MRVLSTAGLPVLSWAPDLEEGAFQQAVNCARLPVAFHHVAVMADGHKGYGVPIGAVLALDGAISPYAVGNDIGCGMALVPTTLDRGRLLAPATGRGDDGAVLRDELMGQVQATIPSGPGSHRQPMADPVVDSLLERAWAALAEAASVAETTPSTSSTLDARASRELDQGELRRRGQAQAGTLGSGNHFVELLADPEGGVWVMLHSGSRGVGGLVCNNFHRMALAHCDAAGEALPDPGLAWLPLAGEPVTNGDGDRDRWSRIGACYLRALRAALDYAEHNRRRMLEAVAAAFHHHAAGALQWDAMVNIHHNDATAEEHYGRRVWVHRKGAVKAAAGTSTITPGSMGTGSYLGRGRGRPESFSSCSHGAGRVMSRGRARRELSLDDQLATVGAAGGKVFAASTEAVLDEMPSAYKNLDQVMANQADLVEPVLRLTPLATYKGADAPRRRRRGWRPDEER